MSTRQPLRDEHEELLPHIDEIRDVADSVGSVPDEELRERIAEVLAFLQEHLIPHAKAEEAVLYPEVELAMASPRAMAPMSRGHVEVVALTAELGDIARRLLYGLYAPDGARETFERMEAAAVTARQTT